jgi:hypothetical protein
MCVEESSRGRGGRRRATESNSAGVVPGACTHWHALLLCGLSLLSLLFFFGRHAAAASSLVIALPSMDGK